VRGELNQLPLGSKGKVLAISFSHLLGQTQLEKVSEGIFPSRYKLFTNRGITGILRSSHSEQCPGRKAGLHPDHKQQKQWFLISPVNWLGGKNLKKEIQQQNKAGTQSWKTGDTRREQDRQERRPKGGKTAR